MINWDLVGKKLKWFYEEFASKRCKSKTKGMRVERKAARQAYLASVVETANPKRKGKEFNPSEKDLLAVTDEILVPFLSGKKYDTATCIKAMEDIRNRFQSGDTFPFTYGNAQKWVNMAMKYYVVHTYCLSGMSAEEFFKANPCFTEYQLFAVDNIIEKAIQREFGISFTHPKKWHDRDTIEEFEDYWEKVKLKTEEMGYPTPFLWEIVSWLN